MRLIGSLNSPYVRRVAVSLNALGTPYTQDALRVFQTPDAVRKHNPLVRVPVLVLGDGDELVESYAILDALDELAGPDKRLIPASGPERRHVMKITAVGTGTMDKAVVAYYEVSHRPEEKVHQPWLEHNEGQALGGLGYLDGLAEAAGDSGWIAGGDRMTQADITAVVAYSFANKVRPKLGLAAKVPNLAKFAARCEAMEAFETSALPA
jgi:glutathione S-transferase